MYNLKNPKPTKPITRENTGQGFEPKSCQKNAHVEIPRMSDFGRYWQFDDINMDDIDER